MDKNREFRNRPNLYMNLKFNEVRIKFNILISALKCNNFMKTGN